MARVNNRIVVLDIGGSSIRGAEVSYGKTAYPTIHKIEEIPLRSGVIVNGQVQTPDALVNSLRDLWDKAKFTTKKVKFGIEEGVSTRSDITDWVSDEDFHKVLPHSINKIFQIDANEIEKYYYQHHTISEYTVKEIRDKDPDFDLPGETVSVPKKHVIIAIVRKTVVEKYVEALQEAKLMPVEIDFVPFALIRASKNITRRLADAAEVSINLGAGLVTIAIHSEKQPLYIRTLPGMAGAKMTSMIAEELTIEPQRAEAKKLKIIKNSNVAERQITPSKSSIFVSEEDKDDVNSSGPVIKLTDEALSVVKLVLSSTSEIINVVNQTLEYQKNANPRIQRYSHINLSGGLSEVPKFVNRMGSELKTPIDISNPFLDAIEYGVEFEPQGSNPSLPYPDEVKGREHFFTTLIGLSIKGGSED